jgi:hypothetical protein
LRIEKQGRPRSRALRFLNSQFSILNPEGDGRGSTPFTLVDQKLTSA